MLTAKEEIVGLTYLLEGEGSYQMTGTVGRPNQVRCRIELTNTSKEIIDFTARIFREASDHHVGVYPTRAESKGNKKAWKVSTPSKNSTFRICLATYPYLFTNKKLQCGLMILFLQKSCQSKKYFATDFDKNLVKICQAIREGQLWAIEEARSLINGMKIRSELYGDVER